MLNLILHNTYTNHVLFAYSPLLVEVKNATFTGRQHHIAMSIEEVYRTTLCYMGYTSFGKFRKLIREICQIF